ncbi:hypothetical protein HCZ30_06620 [Marivivens donghaensis]|uniref:PRC-barrel domain-containing protein n=1 Tax=Marivivens donghaensis TaxID=1699413 RepID=A0ABX0VXX5_9RHOB|nr:PRC-barrel domain-containing protein [Marivivens donghaensis]NIY72106.1 hypothetical protein [Marivivens donghaensis]
MKKLLMTTAAALVLAVPAIAQDDTTAVTNDTAASTEMSTDMDTSADTENMDAEAGASTEMSADAETDTEMSTEEGMGDEMGADEEMSSDTEMDAEAGTDLTADTEADAMPDGMAEEMSEEDATVGMAADTEMTGNAYMDGWVEISMAGGDFSAEELIDADVVNAENDTVSSIDDLILNEDGSIQAVIMDVGGFLGIGEKSVEVSYDELTILKQEDGEDIKVYMNTTEDALNSMPEYEKDAM